ncbi:MAG TPA: hypothetical protein VL498_02430 [Terracidiphilus sp.]|nr:hypothetical protein [Terracidiphilus sp.]
MLTVFSTFMVGRKHWMGLVIASINSVIICLIGWHTGQYGFIPANIFCILVYAWSIRSWRRDRIPALVTAAAPAPRLPSRPHNRAIPPTRRVHSGLFLAYRASSSAQMELQAAKSLTSAGSAAGANRI